MARASDPRSRIVDALMALAGEQRFEEISISAICAKAGVSLADFRDAFPSKGAVLAGFSKRIDRIVLQHHSDEMASESPKERLFDVLMRRLDAMSPYREGLREIGQWLRRDPLSALAVNQVVVNSMRFMLEAAGIDSEGGAGALKLQGLALSWARIVNVWLDDKEPELSKTMAALDRELTRGERFVAGVDSFDRVAGPLKALARAAFDTRRRAAESFRRGRAARRAREPDPRERRALRSNRRKHELAARQGAAPRALGVSCHVRCADRPFRRAGDFAQWSPLWEGYNSFYERVVPAEVTAMTWSRFFDAYEPVHAMVAEKDGALLGLVHYLFHRNTAMIATDLLFAGSVHQCGGARQGRRAGADRGGL